MLIVCVWFHTGAWEWEFLEEALAEKLKNPLAVAQLLDRIRSFVGREKVTGVDLLEVGLRGALGSNAVIFPLYCALQHIMVKIFSPTFCHYFLIKNTLASFWTGEYNTAILSSSERAVFYSRKAKILYLSISRQQNY